MPFHVHFVDIYLKLNQFFCWWLAYLVCFEQNKIRFHILQIVSFRNRIRWYRNKLIQNISCLLYTCKGLWDILRSITQVFILSIKSHIFILLNEVTEMYKWQLTFPKKTYRGKEICSRPMSSIIAYNFIVKVYWMLLPFKLKTPQCPDDLPCQWRLVIIEVLAVKRAQRFKGVTD